MKLKHYQSPFMYAQIQVFLPISFAHHVIKQRSNERTNERTNERMLSNKEETNEVDKPKENRQREESMHLEFCTVYEHQLSTCWAFFHFRHPGVLESHLSPDWWNGGIDRKHRRWRGGWDEQQYHRHKWYRFQSKDFHFRFFLF